MADKFKIEVDGEDEMIAYVKSQVHFENTPAFRAAFLRGSMIAEAKVKENLKKMVYDTPPSPNYMRTQDLFRATMATGKIDEERGAIVTAVGSFIHYAKDVIFGLGGNRVIGPRPYLSKGTQESLNDVIQEMNKAIP